MAGYSRTDLGAYSLGLLDSGEAAEVALHLEACADCRRELREFGYVREMLDLLARPTE